ncbi:hypothetical protein [Paraburkholderia sp. SIMBA_054]|uniref:hypothetical protein n=1 Tax=Paraburkholderia sp. SIMBA_054 TaxID=3085795 RepID=UPI00397963E8
MNSAITPVNEHPTASVGPIKRLVCCCCSGEAFGRQWWNRDTGYGLGKCCIDFASRGVSEEEMKSSYGVRGIHYDVPEND